MNGVVVAQDLENCGIFWMA